LCFRPINPANKQPKQHIFYRESTSTYFVLINFVCITVKYEISYCTLVDLQLDAQNSYLFTYNTFIKILYMFRALPCSSLGGLRRKRIYAASGIVTFLTGAQDSHLQTVTIPEAAYIQLRRRPPEDEQSNSRNR